MGMDEIDDLENYSLCFWTLFGPKKGFFTPLSFLTGRGRGFGCGGGVGEELPSLAGDSIRARLRGNSTRVGDGSRCDGSGTGTSSI
jgi:hypothetical protein